MLLKDYITDWIDYRAAVGAVKASTAEHYQHMLKPLYDELGQETLDKVTANTVRKFVYNDVKTRGAKSAQHRFVIAKAAFAAAKKAGDISTNPFDAIDTPRAPKQDKLKALDAHQSKMLYHRSHHYGVFGFAIRLALATGARRGEVCGFDWQDFDGQNLSVTRNVTLVANKPVVGTPKTHSSARVLPLPRLMSQELSQLQTSTSRGFILGGEPVPMNPGILTRAVNKVLEKEGLGEFTLHNLRHTYATYLLQAGIPIKAVSERLGHSNASITLNVYAQVLPQDNKAVVSAMDSLLG